MSGRKTVFLIMCVSSHLLSEGYLRFFYVQYLYWLFKLDRTVRSLIAMMNNFFGLEGRLRSGIRWYVVVMLILQAGLSFAQLSLIHI